MAEVIGNAEVAVNAEAIKGGVFRVPNKAENGETRGLIFDIQGHSVHDGPGARTTVFMNGCPLECSWCCNPEGLFHKRTMLYSDVKCVCCGACVRACPHGAIDISEDGGTLVHKRSEFCDGCENLECVNACLHEALTVAGKYYTIDDLMKLFRRDRQFWGSRGGVTFSGGEPLLQREFISTALKKCKEAYIHTCIETTACLPSDYFQQVTRYVDWLFVDIKHMDPQMHRNLTGVDNALILKNVEYLAGDNYEGVAIVRIPIIPGVNDSEENVRATARYVNEVGLEVINILPFHRLGESKYRKVGKIYRFAEQTSPSDEYMNGLKQVIESEGLICFVGHETPF